MLGFECERCRLDEPIDEAPCRWLRRKCRYDSGRARGAAGLAWDARSNDEERLMNKAFATIKRGLEQAVRHGKGTVRAEYEFDYSKAERGKYFKRLLKEGSNVVVLDRDVA